MPTQGTPIVIPIIGKSAGLSKSISRAKAALIGFGAAAGAALFSATREFQHFETRFREVGTLLGDISDNELDQLQKDIRDVAKAFGEDTSTVSRAFYDSISAGVANAETAKDFAAAAAKFATAGATDISTGVDLLSSALNAYQLKAEDATRVSDIMFATVRAGKTTVPELAHSFAQFGPPAASLGVKLEEVTAWLAQLTLVGTPTAQAATQIKAAFNELAKPSSALGRHFEAMAGKSFPAFIREGGSLGDALQFIRARAEETGKEMFEMSGSVEAAQAIIAATGPYGDRFKSTIASIGDSAGSTETAFGVMSESLDFNMRVMGAQLNDFKLAIGAVFVPLLIPLVTKVTELIPQMVNAFADWWSVIQETTGGIAGMHANLQEFLLLVAGMLAPKVGVAVQSLKALKVALFELVELVRLDDLWASFTINVLELGDAFLRLGSRIQDIFAPSINEHLLPAMSAALIAISALTSPLFTVLKAANFLWAHFGEDLIPILEKLGEYVGYAIDYLDDFGYALVLLVERILPVGVTFDDVWNGITQAVSSAADAIQSVVDNVLVPAFNRTSSAVSSVTSFINDAIAGMAGNTASQGSSIGNTLSVVGEAFSNFGVRVYEIVLQAGQSVADFAVRLWEIYHTYIHPYLRAVAEAFKLAFEIVRTIIELIIWPLLKALIEWWKEVFGPIWKAILAAAGLAIKLFAEAVKQAWQHVIQPVISAAVAVISYLLRRLAAVMDTVADGLKHIREQIAALRTGTFSLQEALEPFVNFLRRVYGPAWGAVNSSVRAVISSIRTVIDLARDAIDIVKKVPGTGALGKAAGILGSIPGFATGGIVTQPTLAMVGEAGPEAIIPLDKMRSHPNVVININGGLDSADAIGERVEEALVRWRAHKGSLDFES